MNFVKQDSSISVVIPAYNCAVCLKRAIESSLSQAPTPRDVIVVDDGSTDETAEVARSFGDKIRLIQQPNAGPVAARERGTSMAQGEYIAILDADDYWLPGFFAACQNFLESTPGTIAVSVGMRFKLLGRPDKVFPDPSAADQRELTEPFVIKDFFSFWGKHDHVRSGSNLLRRSIVKQAGFQLSSLRISEDLEYWAYLATYGKWGFIPRILWVCDSEKMGARMGWLNKFSIRRKLCPTVEQWQQRIVARLKPEDWPGFKMVRGRVAAGFAQSHILAGRAQVAREIVRNYGTEMPAVWSSRLLRLGDRMSWPGWFLACLLVRGREYQKALAMSLKSVSR